MTENEKDAFKRPRPVETENLFSHGGPRTAGPGKKIGLPKMREDQKRPRVSTRLAPGSKELALAIAEVLGLDGWGRSVDLALVKLVQGDPELRAKLADMEIVVKEEQNQ